MPININQFMGLVRIGNPHYERIKDSSLHRLVQLLQNQPQNTIAIRAEMRNIPNAKKEKYRAAFNFLENNLNGVNTIDHNQPPVAAAAPTGAQTMIAGIPCRGYSIIPDPRPHTNLTTNLKPPFGVMEISRLNEAISVARVAVEGAISVINTINATIPQPATTLQQSLFLNYFGDFDLNRRNGIRHNFMLIHQAINGDRGGTQGSLQIVDARNHVDKQNWFAAAFRGAGTPRPGVQTQIQLYVGRSFFVNANNGNPGAAIDFTIGTIVHELSHACFSASDVPTVAAGGRAALNANGMPPTGGTVCNDASSDRELAANDPEAALLNADSYGQFAWRLHYNHQPIP